MTDQIVTSTPIVKPKNSKRARMDSSTCPKCEATLGKGSDSISCCVCELHFCTKCTNISPLLLEALNEDKSNNFKWTCNGCKQNFPCMTNLSQQLKAIDEKTHNRISNIERKMDNLQEGIGIKVKDEVAQLKSGLVDEIKSEIKMSLQDEVRKEVHEIEDQRERALNLIIFNLPESKSKNSNDRKDYDNKKYEELCLNIGVKDHDYKLTFRLGNYKEGTNRPLKVIMNNKKHRKNILDNAPKIRDLPSTSDLKRCIIVKDLTKRQRETNKLRREEKKKGATKTPQRSRIPSDQYNEETICHDSRKPETTAIIENVRLHNMGSDMLVIQQQSQPLLTPIRRFEEQHEETMQTLPIITDTYNAGDETVIGGIISPLANMDDLRTQQSSNN